VNVQPERSDASACLKLRTPVIRRDRTDRLQNICPGGFADFWRKNADIAVEAY
jgi:hypothetical protein